MLCPMGPPVAEPIGLQVTRTAKLLSRAFDDALAEAGGSLPVWLVLVSVKSGGVPGQDSNRDPGPGSDGWGCQLEGVGALRNQAPTQAPAANVSMARPCLMWWRYSSRSD